MTVHNSLRACSRKCGFKTQARAVKERRRLEGNGEKELVTYFCVHCGRYHNGHLTRWCGK